MKHMHLILTALSVLGDRQPRDPDDLPPPYRDDTDPDQDTTGCDCVPYCVCAERDAERREYFEER